ncbi:breast cancer associated RING 1 isoform X2 [Tasmannia lanceolata]|uniref:breast cancer associated RING 1 isoform X2 n=1 Tax=Tasmannia lanceolata TaxID=3420 RepID=UPI00406499C8
MKLQVRACEIKQGLYFFQKEKRRSIMEGTENYNRSLNPCLLHLQKMGLELKCPTCLNLLNRPLLLPCNHIFCSSCILKLMEFELKCAVCKLPYLHHDLRPSPHMESMVSIYRSMEIVFGANHLQSRSQVDQPDGQEHSHHNPVSSNTNIGEKSRGDPTPNIHREESIHSFPAKKQVQFSPPSKNGVARPSMTKDEREDDFVGLSFHSKKESPVNERNPSLSPSSWSTDQQHKESGTQERGVNQLEQSSPGSPPSFDYIKDSDDDNNDQGSEHGSKGLSANMNQRHTSPAKEEHTRESKKQRKSNCGLHDMPSNTSDHINLNPAALCAFCQSSKDTEASGPMLHYNNGKEIVADQVTLSNVLHVHLKCMEWAPQVYFDGETAMNLEAEVTRGSKIKCYNCGKKGAALGCYAKSCQKSFHVPCAIQIEECRWDCENFLVLCPFHSSLKFPSEKPKSGKKSGKRIKTTHSSNKLAQLSFRDVPSSMIQPSTKLWTDSAGASNEWVLCGSALSAEEKDLLAEFASLTGATVSKAWSPSVTHVIASTGDIGVCSRTLKFLMAILNGRWILKIDWIKACMEAKHPVGEVPYEISCDIHGCCNGPKNGRIRIMDKAPKLFSDLYFYFSGDYELSYKGYLEDLVVAAGGTMLVEKDMLVSLDCDKEGIPSATYVIYNLDPPQRCVGQFSSVIEQRREEAEAFAAKTSSRVVGHTWLLDSIAACELRALPL